MLSWIQYHVLIELTRHSTRRYTELRPKDVEGNLFMYHLNGLVNNKLVEKTDRKYQLTVKGLRFVGTLSLETERTRQQPKILNAIVCKNKAGEYLFSKWHREPNTDLVSFPHGMMHYGEAIEEMASTELAEKAGLDAKLTYRGDIYIRGMRDEEVDRHMLIHIFDASNPLPSKKKALRPDVSESFWSTLQAIPKEQFVPGFYEVAQLVEKQPIGPIFADIRINVNDRVYVNRTS